MDQGRSTERITVDDLRILGTTNILVCSKLSQNYGFSPQELNRIRKMIETHLNKIIEAWHEHCG